MDYECLHFENVITWSTWRWYAFAANYNTFNYISGNLLLLIMLNIIVSISSIVLLPKKLNKLSDLISDLKSSKITRWIEASN